MQLRSGLCAGHTRCSTTILVTYVFIELAWTRETVRLWGRTSHGCDSHVSIYFCPYGVALAVQKFEKLDIAYQLHLRWVETCKWDFDFISNERSRLNQRQAIYRLLIIILHKVPFSLFKSKIKKHCALLTLHLQEFLSLKVLDCWVVDDAEDRNTVVLLCYGEPYPAGYSVHPVICGLHFWASYKSKRRKKRRTVHLTSV